MTAVQRLVSVELGRLQRIRTTRAVGRQLSSGRRNPVRRKRTPVRKHERLAVDTLQVLSAGNFCRGSTALSTRRTVFRGISFR